MLSEWAEAFALGNAAIAGNVCLLPLYPGLFVMLANAPSQRSTKWLGVIVLAGVVTFMILLGFAFHQLRRSVADVLDWLLPLMYGAVLILGLAMVAGRNPFTRLATTESPILRRPAASAYLYGALLAPMTLPCTGPLIVSAFVIGGISGGGALADSLAYFVAFALGFGWPLAVLPLLAAPVQRRATAFLTRHHRAIGVVSGALLVGIAVVGFVTEVLPNR